MPSPFPGMDPYLEQYWGDVRHTLITYTRSALQRNLPSDLVARGNERVFLEHSEEESEPERQGFIEIIDIKSGRKVVTVIEVLSPSNKTPGAGWDMYVKRREELMKDGRVSIVEIDLLRGGKLVWSVPVDRVPQRDRGLFASCVRRGWLPFEVEFYMSPLRGRLPAIRIPLRQSDTDVALDLQALIDQAYEDGRYGDDIDYREEPDPPLAPHDALWANRLLRERGRRGP